MPTRSGSPGRSRNSAKPSSAVKNTWVCSSTLASPAVMPTLSPMNKKPNCPTPWNSPNSSTQRQCMRGGRTSSTSGSAAHR